LQNSLEQKIITLTENTYLPTSIWALCLDTIGHSHP